MITCREIFADVILDMWVPHFEEEIAFVLVNIEGYSCHHGQSQTPCYDRDCQVSSINERYFLAVLGSDL